MKSNSEGEYLEFKLTSNKKDFDIYLKKGFSATYTLNGKESSYFAPASIKRVTITAINGEPFDPEATYAVVTNNFCAAGGDTYNVFNRAYSEGSGFDTGIPMDEAVIEYVTSELEGVITADMYGEPRGSLTQILAEEAEEEVEPAA